MKQGAIAQEHSHSITLRFKSLKLSIIKVTPWWSSLVLHQRTDRWYHRASKHNLGLQQHAMRWTETRMLSYSATRHPNTCHQHRAWHIPAKTCHHIVHNSSPALLPKPGSNENLADYISTPACMFWKGYRVDRATGNLESSMCGEMVSP